MLVLLHPTVQNGKLKIKRKEKKMNLSKNLACCALSLTLTGCLSDAVTFSASSIPCEQGKYTVLADEVTGTCTEVNWLFFTFGKGGSGQRHALDDALAQIPGAEGLVGMAVDQESFMLIPFVLPSFFTVRVTGTPFKLSNAK